LTNILLNRYQIHADWIKPALTEYILPHHRVLVTALSFRDDRIGSAEEWNNFYAPGGKYYGGIVESLTAYGIDESQIEFVNYFTDTEESAREKVLRADILYFPGGLPDKMYERISRLGLTEVMRAHRGIVLGYSAGALIQFSEYHLSPDKDYCDFGYYSGMGWLDGFYMEVHYEGTEVQNESINRIISERGKPVYAVPDDGALIVTKHGITAIGPVKRYDVE